MSARLCTQHEDHETASWPSW